MSTWRTCLSRLGTHADGPASRRAARLVRPHALGDRARQSRKAACAGSDDGDPLAALPDIPTVAEFVPGYETSGWTGVGVPTATPTRSSRSSTGEVNAGLAEAAIKARLADLGGEPLAGSPADFENLIAEETEKWSKVIRAANIKPS